MCLCSAGSTGLSASAESVQFKRRRSKHLNRSSSRCNKENGSRSGSFRNNKNAANVESGANSAALVGGAIIKRKVQRVSFEPSTSGGEGAGDSFDHSKSVEVIVIERRNSTQMPPHEFSNRLSVDNDLLVHTLTSNTTAPNDTDSSTTTHSKPPRIWL